MNPDLSLLTEVVCDDIQNTDNNNATFNESQQ